MLKWGSRQAPTTCMEQQPTSAALFSILAASCSAASVAASRPAAPTQYDCLTVEWQQA